MSAVLAIDWGTKKSGFAIADALRIIVKPHGAVRLDGDSDELLDHIAELGLERSFGVVLVSLPVQEDGTDGGQAQLVRAFVERLSARFPEFEVIPYPERLTSKEAENRLRDEGYRGKQLKELRDAWSAWVLLEDWLRSGEPRP